MQAEDAARRDAQLLAAAARVVNDPNAAVARVLVHGYVNSYTVVGQLDIEDAPAPATHERAPIRKRFMPAGAVANRCILLYHGWRQLLHNRRRHDGGRAASSSG
jgi:hypothetical protein